MSLYLNTTAWSAQLWSEFFSLIFRCVSTSILHKFPPSLPLSHLAQHKIPLESLLYLKTCLPNVSRHVQPMVEDMFTKSFMTCLPNVRRPLPNVWWNVKSMFEVMFTQLKTCLNTFSANFFCDMFDEMFSQCSPF